MVSMVRDTDATVATEAVRLMATLQTVGAPVTRGADAVKAALAVINAPGANCTREMWTAVAAFVRLTLRGGAHGAAAARGEGAGEEGEGGRRRRQRRA